MHHDSSNQDDEARDALIASCRATLLFYKVGAWTATDAALWLILTGSEDASTRNLCDTVRAALAKAGVSE